MWVDANLDGLDKGIQNLLVFVVVQFHGKSLGAQVVRILPLFVLCLPTV